MGLLDRIHQHHAQHVAEIAEDHYKAALAEWTEADAHLQSLLKLAKSFGGQTSAENPNLTLLLKRYERAFFTLTGAGLVEPRRGPGHWQGRVLGVQLQSCQGRPLPRRRHTRSLRPRA